MRERVRGREGCSCSLLPGWLRGAAHFFCESGLFPSAGNPAAKVGQCEGKAGPSGNAGTRGRGCQLMGQEGEEKGRAMFLKSGDFPRF